MELAGTVIYVDSVPEVLAFYESAFGIETAFVDLDVQVPGRDPGELYQFAALEVGAAGLQLATHALGALLMPVYTREGDGAPRGVEIAFYSSDVPTAFARAVAAGATSIAEPKEAPWGQTVSYVRSIEGTFVGICSPLDA